MVCLVGVWAYLWERGSVLFPFLWTGMIFFFFLLQSHGRSAMLMFLNVQGPSVAGLPYHNHYRSVYRLRCLFVVGQVSWYSGQGHQVQ